jgi:hypothetical protein
MSRRKYAHGLDFFDVVPRLMKITGVDSYVDLAKILEITPQSINKFKNDKKFPTDRIIKFAVDKDLSLDYVLFGREGDGKPSHGTKEDGPPSRMPKERESGERKEMRELKPNGKFGRRIDDIEYSMVRPISDCTPEVHDGKPILKLLLLKEVFASEYRHLEDIVFMKVDTYAFMPAIFPGNLLFIDKADKEIKDGMYVFRLGDGLALRKVQPLHSDIIRVTHRENGGREYTDQKMEDVKRNIVGRVVGVFYKT